MIVAPGLSEPLLSFRVQFWQTTPKTVPVLFVMA